MKSRILMLGLTAGLLLSMSAGARGKSGVFTVNLRYIAPESADDSLTLAPGLGDRPVRVTIVEGRSDPAGLGESSDDDDKMWPVRAGNDPIAWANEVLAKSAAGWGIKVADNAPLALDGKLTRLELVESNKAMGSTYHVDAQLAFTLKDARGRTLWEGAASGDATRYGKSRSEDNANEVFRDALTEAFSELLGTEALQEAWAGKGTPVASAPAAAAAPDASAMAPSDLLADLVKLKKQGFTTDLLVDYVNGKSLTRELSADDLVKWKNAGMPQEVIRAAMDKAKS
jgi:hypothetical protein